MAVPVKYFFYSVYQSVSHSIASHMFECFVRFHMLHFISSWVVGGRDVGLSLDLCFGVWKSVVLKLSFVGEWGWFYFEFLGIIFIGVIFFSFSLFCGVSLLIFVQYSFIHTIFFHVFGGSVSVGHCAFCVRATTAE